MPIHDEILGLGVCKLELDLAPELVELLLNHLIDILFLVSDLAKQGQVCGFLMRLSAEETSFCPHLDAALDADTYRLLRFFRGIE